MINKLIEAAFVVVLAAAAAGQIPRLIQTVGVAELQLLRDSQSTKWGRPMLLQIRSKKIGPSTLSNIRR